jgi:hypothetical protein
VDAGLNIEQLVHVEGEESTEDSDDDAELDGTEHWEPAVGYTTTTTAAAAAVGGDEAKCASGASHPSGDSSPTASSDSSHSTPTAVIKTAGTLTTAGTAAGAAQLQRLNSAGSFAGGDEDVGDTCEVADVRERSNSVKKSKLNKSGSTRHLSAADFASAGSVKGASLKLAAGGSKAPRSLSMVRLATEANRNLTGVEAREQGNVSSLVLKTYINAGGGWLVALLVVALMALEQGSRVFTDTWLSFWTSNLFNQGMWFYIGIYAACGVLYSLLTYLRFVPWVCSGQCLTATCAAPPCCCCALMDGAAAASPCVLVASALVHVSVACLKGIAITTYVLAVWLSPIGLPAGRCASCTPW